MPLLTKLRESLRQLNTRQWLALGLGIVAVPFLLLAITALLVWATLPNIDELSDYRPKQPLRVYTADGVQIGEFGTERRTFQPLDQIPQLMQDALLATEDAAFYEHGGLSLSGITRAALANLSHGRSQGGSTITQQLARTFYLTKKKNYTRKFIEMLLALKIEGALSKKQILEVYMNQIYLGQRAYGFEAAASAYFGKSLKELSIAETAMLAGLPQNPAYANPIVNPARAQRRMAIVLDRMQETGVINAEQAAAAKAEKLHIRSSQDERLHAEYAAEMARQVVFAQYGDESYTRGLKVYTTLVAAEQEAAYHALRRSLTEFERRKPYRGPEGFVELPEDEGEQDAAIAQALTEHPDNDELRAAVVTKVGTSRLQLSLQNGEELTIAGEGLRSVQAALSDKARAGLRIRRGSIVRVLQNPPPKAGAEGSWVVVQSPEAEGALVALEPANGRVHALVGGFDFARNQFNHVTQAWRQPGSSFKPFVYSAALERGVGPATVVNDAPVSVDGWEPKNYDGTFDGPMTVREALARSKNMVTIRLVQLLGPARVREWASRFGFDSDKQPDNLTLSLGAGSVTPLQMAAAYAVIANGGYRIAPLVIARIEDSKGTLLFEADKPRLDEAARVIPERNAFVMASLLQEVARSGTAARAQAALRRPDIYGKTGTTNESVDAWFAGFQPSLAAVVWIGYDQPRGLGERETGGGLALPAWIDFMTVALKGQPVQEIAPPAEGLLQLDGDWSFAEFAGEDGVKTLGLEPPSPLGNDPSGALLPQPPGASAPQGAPVIPGFAASAPG
ncbi:penicillin-binding protein 1A [Roseateles violae]|uniref:Penicillin-binding protein 1A n=1 Tax=Roseateles violae TaxID=3058042 RepID=A0ABT8DU42_9BURK|nr:PBP1A family penicillin-binding protein [Pelomonas sp. PFR6]MDN3921821.1 PBP1A family penicillin-binding protein [Pelomonas sp. PFR6]